MPQYVINHSYRASRDGQPIGPWSAGDTVELSEADAEWLERDSPGVLCAPAPAEVAQVDDEASRQQPPARDRQARGGRNRGA